VNSAGGVVFDEYLNKNSYFDSLTRSISTNAVGGTSSLYTTFRRVGQLSDPNSWIHPGLQAKNLAEQAVQETNIDTIVNNTVDSILSDFGF
jgi:hypothetical protein